jgi:cytoskeletal protein CcmA (bactofilin family)
MAIFKRIEGNMSTGSAPVQLNMLAEGTVLEGNIDTTSDVRISGRIVGRARVSGKAIVAQDGSIEGELFADTADVGGRVQGELRIAGKLVLKSTAIVDGNVHAHRIVMEEGAVLNGKCFMGEENRMIDPVPVIEATVVRESD